MFEPLSTTSEGRRPEGAAASGDRVHQLEIAVGGLIVAFVGTYWAACSVLIHRSFHSNGWDLGLINQVIWNSAEGRIFEYSFRDMSFAGDHWQPFLLALVPFKWFDTGPEGLLILQAFILAIAAVPLYLAVRPSAGWPAAAAVTAAYLLGLGTARAVSYDFHAEAFAPLLAFVAFWSIASRRRVAFAVIGLLILTLKEDGALLTLSLCWIAWAAFGERATAAAVGFMAMAYGVVATGLVIPHFRGADLNPFAERYGYLGDAPLPALLGILRHPDAVVRQLVRGDALEAIVIVLASCAFMPLLAPKYLAPLVVVTGLPLLSMDAEQGALHLHYLLVPTTVALVITGVALREGAPARCVHRAMRGLTLAPLEAGLRRGWVWALAALPVVLLAAASPLPPSFAADIDRFRVGNHARISSTFVSEIPRDAIVSAQSPFAAHLSERQDLYQFPRVLDAQFVIVDASGPIPAPDLAAGYAECLAALPRLGFDKIREQDGITLWRKRRTAEYVPEAPVACSGQHTQNRLNMSRAAAG